MVKVVKEIVYLHLWLFIQNKKRNEIRGNVAEINDGDNKSEISELLLYLVGAHLNRMACAKGARPTPILGLYMKDLKVCVNNQIF